MMNLLLLPSLLAAGALARCYEPSPAFPVPLWDKHDTRYFVPVFDWLENKLDNLVADSKYDSSSFSVELTSNTETLWTHFHTARKQNSTRPGTQKVDGDSLYRIASITKVFTTLGVLHQNAASNLSLDDPISRYIPELAGPDSGKLPWDDITLRILASQLSGIPREFAQSDVINESKNPIDAGLPPLSEEDVALPTCDEYEHYEPCGRKDLIDRVKRFDPLFAPNQKSTYSNIAFELLGLAIENASGVEYSEYIANFIFDPISMTSSSFDKPSDKHAVLPLGENYWDVEEGIQRATGGIYSSSGDMSKFLRYVLTHYNTLAKGINWILPASWGTGLQSFYGMPWEIFRTDEILFESKRPVTFVTKSGGLPGYFSTIFIMPEYGFGLTILVAGEPDLLSQIRNVVTVNLVQAAEEFIWRNLRRKYPWSFASADPALNSSLELGVSESRGLHLSSFISNGTDVLHDAIPGWLRTGGGEKWHAQLVPTLLYKNETTLDGEVWRIAIVSEREAGGQKGIWDEFCPTDIDQLSYGGLPLNEVVFWFNEDVLVVELPAWRVKMQATVYSDHEPMLVKQGS